MVETLTPAVCGGRHRQRLAVVLFGLGAVLSGAALGALLGALGAPLPRPAALGVAASLAGLAALREAGILRLPLPGARRQVPERWRRDWPLPAWSLAYGAGLGLGVLTHQVTTTFWVVCAATLALGQPLAGAAALACFGAGRALMVAVPARGGRDPSAAVAALIDRRGLLRPLNVAALTVLAVAAGLPATAAAQVPGREPSGRFDPSASGRLLAYSERQGSRAAVVVRAPGGAGSLARVPGAREPALDGRRLAYVDADGIRVVSWRDGRVLARVRGPVGKPALDWPLLAYVRDAGRAKTLVLRDLVRGRRVTLSLAGSRDDLGRPTLVAGRIAWHLATGRRNLLLARAVRAGAPVRVIANSATAIHVNPSLDHRTIVWVESRGVRSTLRARRIDRAGAPSRSILSVSGADRILWTTAISGRRVFVTRWSLAAGRAGLLVRSL